jgi:hypothetical protein
MNQKLNSFIFVIISMLAGQTHGQGTVPFQASSPVLIELFTSQGCSSCPPAEKILNTWGMTLFKTRKALPLAFHVDYWDNLGWKDPFSIPLATNRQRQYTDFYNATSLFTPEMTVNGQLGFNGADLSEAKNEFSQSALLTGLAPIKLKTLLGHQALRVQVFLPSNTLSMGDPTVNVAVFENDLSTKVLGGENNGRFLEENFVVRYHNSILKSSISPSSTWEISIPLGSSWKLSNIGVGVWLQDSRTMKSQGLSWVYPVSN